MKPGTKPKPTHLKLVTGNPGKRTLNRKEAKAKAAITETDRWDNKWLSKQRAINKIDAAVALCMAVGSAMAGDTSGSIDDWLKSLA